MDNIPDQFKNDTFAPFNGEDNFITDDDGNLLLDEEVEITEEQDHE